VNYDNFKKTVDRAIAIAIIKSTIWVRPYIAIHLKYVRYDDDIITVFGTDVFGEVLSEKFPMLYLELGDKQIVAIEEAKFNTKVNTSNNKRRDNGIYIGLRHVR